MGMRVTGDQVVPSDEELITMSLDEQPVRKRQSDQTTNTFPAPSISAEGRLGLRIPPASRWLLMVAMETLRCQVLPPSVDLMESMPNPSNGTMTVPLGWTKGSPPSPVA